MPTAYQILAVAVKNLLSVSSMKSPRVRGADKEIELFTVICFKADKALHYTIAFAPGNRKDT